MFLENRAISSPICNWMVIWWNSLSSSKFLYNGDNYEMLIRILHSFLNRSIIIIMDWFYSGNPLDSWVILCTSFCVCVYIYIYIYIYTHTHKGGLKSSYENMFVVLTNGIQTLQLQWNGMWTIKGIMLKNNLHLVTFHDSILVSLCTFQPILIYIINAYSLFEINSVASVILSWWPLLLCEKVLRSAILISVVKF